MPWLKASSIALPSSHERCGTTPCLACAASRHLTKGDMQIVDFFSVVQDQTVNLTPMGVEGGGPHVLAPRLEGWVAACELYEIPREDRAHMVQMARTLFEGVHGRVTVHDLHRIPVSALAEPTPGDLDG